MNTIILPIATVIDRLMALSAVRGALAERNHALVGHRHEAAIRILIPLAVSRLAAKLAPRYAIECTAADVICIGDNAMTVDLLCLLVIKTARQLIDDNVDIDNSMPSETTLPPPRTCHWH